MTREEIYEHLAQVYLGKKQSLPHQSKKSFHDLKTGHVVLIFFILVGSFYGLSAFLSRKVHHAHAVIFSLNHNPIRIKYNLNEPYPPVESFSLALPVIDASKYRHINFAIRGLEDGYPGVVRVVIKNRKNEIASFFVEDVKFKWKKVSIPTDNFREITDWTSLRDISFVLESWNTDKKKGTVLIDDVSFSS